MTKNFKKFGLVLSLSLFAISSVVYAGTLTPSATPAATSYTLTDIYTRLTTNASATLADHVFTPGGSPAASLYTLTQIYDSVPTIDATKVKLGQSYLGVAGSLVPNGGTATAAGLFNGLTAHLSGDWDLDTGTLDLACNTATFNATANLVATTYDGSGDGSNRWCMTDSGDAIADNILSGKIAWVDGLVVNGTMSAGYTYGDSNAALVLGTATGAGTALLNLWNGTSGAFTGGSQANGGADDYNNGGAVASGGYAKGWTACNAGNSYCGTSDSGANAKDDSTGLVWSLPCNGSGCASFSDSSPLTYSWNGTTDADNNSRTASQLCSDHSGWSLPHQKQLMQAYIDGSYGILESTSVSRTYWSASTVSSSTTNAWYIYLSRGYTTFNAKTGSNYVRCVR